MSKKPRRFSAKLLFCYVVGDANRRIGRTLETRIVCFDSRDLKSATTKFEKYGRAAAYSFTNDAGGLVEFEFVGIVDVIEPGDECDANEFWYDIESRLCTVAELRKGIASFPRPPRVESRDGE